MSDTHSSQDPINPYAPPTARLAPSGADPNSSPDAEAIRHQYLKHEASIRSIGSLYYFGAIMLGLSCLVFVIQAIVQLRSPSDSGESFAALIGTTAITFLLALLYRWIGKGLRSLDNKVVLVTTVLLALGLLGIPIGTLISAYFLYLIHSKKGKMVLSPEYRAIVAQTPHIRYRTPVWILVLLAVIVIAIVAAFFYALS
ncbi:MAG: hypothetical protein AAGN66_04865 [Acidobacteriota bacterium]